MKIYFWRNGSVADLLWILWSNLLLNTIQIFWNLRKISENILKTPIPKNGREIRIILNENDEIIIKEQE